MTRKRKIGVCSEWRFPAAGMPQRLGRRAPATCLPLPAYFASCFLASYLLAGCGSGLNSKLGSISVTDPSGAQKGQLTSVVVNATAAVSVAVSGDPNALGVDWNLTCLGSSMATYTTNPCGTLNPLHVGSNINMLYTAPAYVTVGNTVTLTAAVTSDPSQQARVTLTILPQPIAIAFTGTAPPASLGASETAPIVATVTNDLLAQGVNWKVSCRSSSCGSVSPTLSQSGEPTTFTAPASIPAGGAVTVTASAVANSSAAVSVMIQILPITVSVVPAKVSVPARGSVPLTATVANDASNAGVDWEAPVCATAGDCGTVSPAHTASGTATTYSAPLTVPTGKDVTVTVKSTSDPKVKAAVKITIAQPPPIGVSLKVASDLLQLGGATSVTATVTNDYANAGINWNGCSPGICSPSQSTTPPYITTYTAPTMTPADNEFTLSASSLTDPTKIGTAHIKIAPTISVKITSAPTSVTAGSPAKFSAAVTNEIGNAGVDWTATNCGANDCGTFSPSKVAGTGHTASGGIVTYIPPLTLPATNVTIMATSTASETVTPVEFASTQVSVIPVPYPRFVPFAPSALPVTNPSSPAPASLIAVAANDTTGAGVDWKVCGTPSTCGEFQLTPAIPATFKALAIPPTYSASLHAASGQAVTYLPPTQVPSTGNVTIDLTATVDKATIPATIAIVNESTGFTGVALSGVVEAGTLPISGASVELYAAGNTGYASGSSPLVIASGGTSVTTATDGSFTIPAGYACPSQYTLLYLVALQGDPGPPAGSNLANPRGLITALGPCEGLNSSASIKVNEVTTIASIWALAPFTGEATKRSDQAPRITTLPALPTHSSK